MKESQHTNAPAKKRSVAAVADAMEEQAKPPKIANTNNVVAEGGIAKFDMKPPYFAVIFSSIRESNDSTTSEDYSNTAERMVELAAQQEGFLGVESARDGLGITVSYWKDTDSIKNWKTNCEHKIAQAKGKDHWYKSYKTRICKVEREYEFEADS